MKTRKRLRCQRSSFWTHLITRPHRTTTRTLSITPRTTIVTPWTTANAGRGGSVGTTIGIRTRCCGTGQSQRRITATEENKRTNKSDGNLEGSRGRTSSFRASIH